jgi:CubicO group peptidase (beta-lactamase class C family)
MKYLVFTMLALFSINSVAQKKITAKQIQEFDEYVNMVRKQWEVPGMSITVVKDNQVIFKKGYGVRELGKPELVDTETLFACASTTKAMTVTLMGMLVDEGKVKWDDKVYKYLPELQFHDPYVTREVTIRDLLIHNTGLGGTDYFTGALNLPLNEIFKKIALVKPAYSFRSGFEYQNLMYSAAGRIIERLTGKVWSDVIQERIFIPLGMNQTAAKRKFIKGSNITKPHYNINDTIKVIGYGGDSEIGSAGAVWSNADDISKWVICMLDSSKYTGGRLLKAETWKEMFTPQNNFPVEEYPTLTIVKPNWMTYGLGWYQHDYKGHKVNFHTGSLSGLTAITAQLPDEKLGLFVFGNYDHAEVRHVLFYKTLDWFAMGGNQDWNAAFKTLYSELAAENKKRKLEFLANRIENTSPSLPMKDYGGRYNSPLYGEAVVSVSGDTLTVHINDVVKVNLKHWHYDTFNSFNQRGWGSNATARFTLTVSGKVDSVVYGGMEFKKVDR